MVQYYYDKYNAIITNNYTEPNWNNDDSIVDVFFQGTRASHTWDSSNGTWTLTGITVGSDVAIKENDIYHALVGTKLYRYVAKAPGNSSYRTLCYAMYKDRTTAVNNPTYSRGSLIQSNIPAEDGTYPANGRHTDGFWYVKGSAVGPLPPGQVINQSYSLQGNGGRKLVRLSDGTLMTVIRNVDYIKVYISQNEGSSWAYATQLGIASLGTTDVVITAINTNEVGFMYSYGNSIRFRKLVRNGNSFSFAPETTLDTPTSITTMSLAFDKKTGFLHAVWSCITPTYPNTVNIRYARSTNGGVTWESSVNATSSNVGGTPNSTPTIVARQDGVPVIIYSQYNGSIFNLIAKRYENGSWQEIRIYGGGSFEQTNPSAVIDKNGAIHVAWMSKGSGSKCSIVYCRSLDGGATWGTAQDVTGYVYSWTNPTLSVDNFGKVAVVYSGIHPSVSTTVNNIIARYVTDNVWTTPVAVTNRTSGSDALNPSVLHDMNASGSFGTVPSLVYQTATSIEYTGTYTINNAPTINVTSPINNQTLYENDVMNINGDAYDMDKDQSVTVYYQIDSDPRKVLATNFSQTQISLSKQLKFKAGKLYDGDTAITSNLMDGVEHKLKVWAVDSENTSSSIVERTFYVVPNRAPLLSVDAVVPSGVVDADKFEISGKAWDQDANSNLNVTRRINNGNAVEIYSGQGGDWEFEIALAQLQIGENVIVIEVLDNYGAKTSKTIKLNKNEVNTPILQSVARYKIEPPKGTAKGVLLFIERDIELDLKVELSMTLAGEQEQYETLIPEDTAPMSYNDNIVEDTFYYETTEPKENIVLKLSTTRPDDNVNHKIHLISGAVE